MFLFMAEDVRVKSADKRLLINDFTKKSFFSRKKLSRPECLIKI